MTTKKQAKVHVEFLVSGWENRQIAKGDTYEAAVESAISIANGEENITWISECTPQEADEISASW